MLMQSLTTPVTALLLVAAHAFAADDPDFRVAEREVVATRSQRDALGLSWFPDGNVGMAQGDANLWLYAANGSNPVRVGGTRGQPLRTVQRVTIHSKNKSVRYLAGGPLYRDPDSGRLFLFYHAEIHRRSDRDFYSVLGLAIQSDTDGLAFADLGPIYTANIPRESAQASVELCGAPYVVREGYFYMYARDVMQGVPPTRVNLSVARAKVADVVAAGLAGQNVIWKKFHEGSFAEPALGGRSTALEKGNPDVRWMDVSYNNVLRQYIMIVAANTAPRQVAMFVAWSDDGITWSDRRKFADDHGECFYPSILGFGEDQRQTGAEFYVYYTSSATGSFERWNDAVIARRKVTVSRR